MTLLTLNTSKLNINNHIVSQSEWDKFTEEDHRTWQTLFERQTKLLEGRAIPEIVEGMKKLSICSSHIPKISEINKILNAETNFSVVPVDGLIPDDMFFKFLSERKFPTTCFIRKPHQLDYLEEPDIFHDVFGHVPLLVDPIFADFIQQFGIKGLEAIELGMLKFAATLYWFTVEFGLIKTHEGLRIYGAGITSSKAESIYCLESEISARIKFHPERVMKTQYHIDSFQRTYFVIESFKQLFDSLKDLDWNEVKHTCLNFPAIEQGVWINQSERIL